MKKRSYVIPQDVCNNTGKGIRYAQTLLKDLKIVLGKEKWQVITPKELAERLGLEEADLYLE